MKIQYSFLGFEYFMTKNIILSIKSCISDFSLNILYCLLIKLIIVKLMSYPLLENSHLL